VGKDIRALIFRMAAENPTWGAPRIHGELLKLGFQVSEPTVSRWAATSAESSRSRLALADVPARKFLLFDRDSKFGHEVLSAARAMGTQPIGPAFRSPWQNGVPNAG
jgi:hypothetical protein